MQLIANTAGEFSVNQELFLMGGDFNIDCIEQSQKVVKRPSFITPEYMEKMNRYYVDANKVDCSSEVVRGFLERQTRYGLMMALLNSGKLRIWDLQQELNQENFVTFGEAYKNEETGEFHPLEVNLFGKLDLMTQQGLDYVFIATQPEEEIQNSAVQIESIQRKEFYIEDRNYKQLSDHFGLALNIRISV